MLSKFIVYVAYYLNSSDLYKKSKIFFYDILENPHSRKKRVFDATMIVLIAASILMLIYGVEHEAPLLGRYFELAVFLVFISEYLLRGWIFSDSYKIVIEEYEKAAYLNIDFKLAVVLKKILRKNLEYVGSHFAIIDLLALLPSYSSVSILRIFIIFRLFKLFRYSTSAKLFADVLASRRFELLTLLVLTCFMVFIASISIFLFEYKIESSNIWNLFDAFYWAIVTLATVGYGDIVPQTTGGRWVAIFVILISVAILSFFTSILIAAFGEKMLSMRENRIYDELDRYTSFIIICGFGRVGQEIARHLQREGQKFVVIDKAEGNIQLAKQLGYLAIQNDASKNEVLINAGICRKASDILCITGDDVINVYITLTSRHLNKNIRIISRANCHENVNKLYQAGADNVILPFEVAGMLAAEFLGQPVAFEAISGILQEQRDIVMETILVTENSPLENQQIGQLNLWQRKLTLLGVISDNTMHLKHKNKYKIKHRHFYFNPAQHFMLRPGDMLVVLGRKYGIEHFRGQMEQPRLLGKFKT